MRHNRQLMELNATSATKIREMAEANIGSIQVLVEAMKLEQKMRKRKMRHEAELASDAEWHKLARETLGIVGPDFAAAFRMWMGFGDAGAAGAAGGTLSSQLSEILTGIDEDMLRAEIGDDVWDLLKAGRSAKSDTEFRAIGQRIREVWEAEGQSAVTERMKRIAPILGPQKLMALVGLLKRAGIVD